MRAIKTITVRLDDGSEVKHDGPCQSLALSQSGELKAGLAWLQRQSTRANVLAERLWLIGRCSSAAPGMAAPGSGCSGVRT